MLIRSVMRMNSFRQSYFILLGLFCLQIFGCQNGNSPWDVDAEKPASSARTTETTKRNVSSAGDASLDQARSDLASTASTKVPGQATSASVADPSFDQPLALANNQAITIRQLYPYLLEAAGGPVLLDFLIDQGLARRLQQQKLTVNADQISAERSILLQALSPDPDTASRLLDELRKARSLGERRFLQLLRRNAGLRLLIANQVVVTDAAIQQAYDLQYGARYQVRLITVDSSAKAAELVRKARENPSSFIDLVFANSTDSSRMQAGMIPPVHPADPTYPAAIRQAVTRLQPGEVSDPIALERGFAILKLEQKNNGPEVRFDDVKGALATRVRRQSERLLMQQLVREIILESQPAIFDADLNNHYIRSKSTFIQE